MHHVADWTPRTGVPLTHREVENLADALRLTEIWSGGDAPPIPRAAARQSASTEAAAFVGWLQSLEQRIITLEQELADMRARERQRQARDGTAPAALTAPTPDDDECTTATS
jgi:hypothetical protein